MMNNEFKTTSSPKVIVLCDKQIVIDYTHLFLNLDTITLDTITCYNTDDVIQLVNKHKLQIDVIAIHTDNQDTQTQYFNKLSVLPEYYKYRIVSFNDYTEHCEEIYNIISRQINDTVSPRYSFITPLYNTNIKYFKQAYESLKQQAINNWEWILLDDSPETIEEINNIAAQDCRLFYYRISPVSNGNIGLVKHHAFMLSHGQWLIELDHDDYVTPNFLLQLEKAISAHTDAGFIYSPTISINSNNKYITNQFNGDFAFGYGVCDEHYGIAYHYNDMNEATLMHIVGVPNHVRCWRRDVYFHVNGHNQYIRACDDYELILKTFLVTRFTRISEPIYVQRFYDNNSQNYNDNLLDINIRVEYIIKYYFKYICEILKTKYNIDMSRFKSPIEVRQYFIEHHDAAHTLNYVV